MMFDDYHVPASVLNHARGRMETPFTRAALINAAAGALRNLDKTLDDARTATLAERTADALIEEEVQAGRLSFTASGGVAIYRRTA